MTPALSFRATPQERAPLAQRWIKARIHEETRDEVVAASIVERRRRDRNMLRWDA
jgi:hypothetical protein